MEVSDTCGTRLEVSSPVSPRLYKETESLVRLPPFGLTGYYIG